MPELPKPMDGEPLSLEQRGVEFTLWPTKRIADGCDLNSRVYVTDPWPFLENHLSSITTEDELRKRNAVHFLRQAEDYYRAAVSASIREAKPVLVYYSFLNLVKSAVLGRGTISDFGDDVIHGLCMSKQRHLVAFPTGNTRSGYKISAFDELLEFLGATRLKPQSVRYIELSHILPQILMGHRIWAAEENACDRFVHVKEVLLMKGISTRSVWLRIVLDEANLKRSKLSCDELLVRTRMKEKWHSVKSKDEESIIIEQRNAEPYTSSPLDKLQELAESIKPYLWQTAVILPPYRTYYLYAAPVEEHSKLLPQLASIYALIFYLGYLTRYYPSEYYDLMSKKYGPFLVGFLQDYPKQFVYLVASELMEREVSSGYHI